MGTGRGEEVRTQVGHACNMMHRDNPVGKRGGGKRHAMQSGNNHRSRHKTSVLAEPSRGIYELADTE